MKKILLAFPFVISLTLTGCTAEQIYDMLGCERNDTFLCAIFGQ